MTPPVFAALITPPAKNGFTGLPKETADAFKKRMATLTARHRRIEERYVEAITTPTDESIAKAKTEAARLKTVRYEIHATQDAIAAAQRREKVKRIIRDVIAESGLTDEVMELVRTNPVWAEVYAELKGESA